MDSATLIFLRKPELEDLPTTWVKSIEAISRKDFFLALSLMLAGIILRLIFPEMMEWKDDEQWLFRESQAVFNGAPWPMVGMPSSRGVVNPGLSIWVFIVFGYFAHDPVALVQFVQWSNVLALLGFAVLFWRVVPKDQRWVWMCGLTLFAVSPLPILYSRKIWQQSVLPPFLLFFLAAYLLRGRVLAKIALGFSMMLLGQLHMSGFILTAALLPYTIWVDSRDPTTRWLSRDVAWLVFGVIIGCIPLIPWFSALLADTEPRNLSSRILNAFKMHYFVYWFGEATGFSLNYYLKKSGWQTALQASPTLLLMGLSALVAFAGSVCISIYAIRLWVLASLQRKRLVLVPPNDWGIYRPLFIGCFWIFGIALSLASGSVYAHYLIVVYPLPHIFAAFVFRNKKRVFWMLACCQLIMSFSFLGLVRFGPKLGGEYGATYERQLENK